MTHSVTLRRHLVGPRTVELDETPPRVDGPVQVVVDVATPAQESLVDFVAALPPGRRTKTELDAEIEEERSSWRE